MKFQDVVFSPFRNGRVGGLLIDIAAEQTSDTGWAKHRYTLKLGRHVRIQLGPSPEAL